ncbi:stealth family protein [Pediococcus ethanolidurans]|uniref:stealth family protein n=1 Tax=Pediococcus ethanolidurans TaxID=319653 RepID=UPI0021A9F2D2|nr:stealth family protein [Pediococcus ethanolidurans]
MEVLVKDFPIDFVVTWVDGQDEAWLKKYNQYSQQDVLDVRNARFRDYGIFKYWFRAVEKYAPWVNHIYLVTDDQVPKWLNCNNPKITVIDHKQIVPHEYLPIFNSNAIELNIYKIDGLAEHFVYFNDDMFLNRKVKPIDFFSKRGLPRDTAGLNAIQPRYDFDYIHVNNMKIINTKFNKKDVMKKQFFKFLNIKNLELNIYTILLFFWPKFTRFFDLHYPYSIRKSTMKRVISENQNEYIQTMKDRFRSRHDITIWLVRYYALVTGNFSVRSPRVGKIYDLLTTFGEAKRDLTNGKHKMIVLNDDANISETEFDSIVKDLKNLFEKKLPIKTEFEKED